LKEQGAHENSSKGYVNHKSYKKEIDATMKGSIHWRTDSVQNGEENLCLWSKEMRSSPEGWFAKKP
jgi:hypothetical protein